MTNTTPAVRIENVTRAYSVNNDQVLAVRGVNMSIERGTFTAFMGRSGSGKTTLLNMIGGLDTPTSGNIYFLGQNTAKLSQDQLTDPLASPPDIEIPRLFREVCAAQSVPRFSRAAY